MLDLGLNQNVVMVARDAMYIQVTNKTVPCGVRIFRAAQRLFVGAYQSCSSLERPQ